MRTNQNLLRSNEAFLQRTVDGYFKANQLLNHWNENNPKKRKDMPKFKNNKSTKDFIEQLKLEGIDKPIVSGSKGTWMHPKMFIDFAMWVSVEFKSIVIDYVLDGLIKSRNDAGDYYNQMCVTIMETHVDYYGKKPNPILYISEAKRIKEMLGISKPRNELSEKELNDITSMQKLNSLLLIKKVGLESRVRQLNQHVELLKL